jgi:hypothetical protein
MEKSGVDEPQRQDEKPSVDADQNINVPFKETQRWKPWLREHLNFFRIHLLVFTFLPLLISIVLWASSGRYKIKYVDALYVCYSAFTNAGT